jgi:hypothetical protein
VTTTRFVVTAARRTPPPATEETMAPVTAPEEIPQVSAALVAHTGPRLWTADENRRTRELRSDPPSARGGGGGGEHPRLSILRIAVWQVGAVFGGVAVLRGSVWLGALAVVTLVAGAGRLRGEWLSTVGGRRLGYVCRRRVFEGEHLPLPADSTLTSTGVLVWAEGMTVVARTSEIGFPQLTADSGGPQLDLQWVGHLGPRQARRPSAWLAITVRRDPDFPSDEQLRVAMDNVLRRVRKDFAVLSGREVRAVLTGIGHAGPSRETWRHWRSGAVTQITFRVSGTVAVEQVLRAGEDASVTVALWPDGDGIIRVAAPDADAAERAARRITGDKNRINVNAERLDGRHGLAVLASLPIGGKL